MRQLFAASFIVLSLVLFIGGISLAPIAHAQGSGVLINPLSSGNCNAANTNCLGQFLTNILKFVVRIGSIVVVLMLVYVGYLFVVAQGNESKISEARKALLWTVVGALILLGAQVIAMGIQATVQSLGG